MCPSQSLQLSGREVSGGWLIPQKVTLSDKGVSPEHGVSVQLVVVDTHHHREVVFRWGPLLLPPIRAGMGLRWAGECWGQVSRAPEELARHTPRWSPSPWKGPSAVPWRNAPMQAGITSHHPYLPPCTPCIPPNLLHPLHPGIHCILLHALHPSPPTMCPTPLCIPPNPLHPPESHKSPSAFLSPHPTTVSITSHIPTLPSHQTCMQIMRSLQLPPSHSKL